MADVHDFISEPVNDAAKFDFSGTKEGIEANAVVIDTAEDADNAELLHWKPRRHEWLIMITLVAVVLVVALDATILVPALPTIAVALNATTTEIFWAGTSYLLACAIIQPFSISLSDVFGRRPILLLSLAVFTFGTILCCTTHSLPILITGRSIQGIGGGGCFALVYVILTDIIPLRQRPTYQSLPSMAWSVAIIAGPLIGGEFAQNVRLGWRWCFYINFPFVGFAFVMAVLSLKLNTVRPHMTLGEKARSIDWVGGFLFISSSCSFLIGITWGGTQYAWSSLQTILPIVLGVAGLVGCILWEAYGAALPFFRLSLFKSRSANAAYFGTFLQGLIMFCILYYLPFYFESCKNASPSVSGLNLMPLSIGLSIVGIAAGVLLTKLGRYRVVLTLGWLAVILGNGILILLDASIPSMYWIPIFIIVGSSHGPLMISHIVSIQASAHRDNVGYAASIYTFMRSLGQCVGVAVGATVFQNTLSHHLSDLSLPISVASNAEAFVSVLKQMPLDSEERQLYVLAYSQSFRNLFEVLTGFSVLGFFVCLLIREYSMDRGLESAHVLQTRVEKRQEYM